MGSNKIELKDPYNQVGICIPTYNAGSNWIQCLQALAAQTIVTELLVIDSGSTDDTVSLARSFGASVFEIDSNEFNHGGTRNKGVELLSKNEIVVFLTQDSILAEKHSLQRLLSPFSDSQVAAVTGRQLPHTNANPIAKHARLYNYSKDTVKKTKKDIQTLGIKTAFCSNSFSAFRTKAFHECGGFPNNTILGEDMYLAAKLLLKDYAVVYCAEATTYHSHNYSTIEEFRRYFDTGVFHEQQPWLLREFGSATGEGKRFVVSELRYLTKNAPIYIPEALLRTVLKLSAYHIGKRYKKLPLTLTRILSMHQAFWK